jgi:hypothetical protein
MNIIQDILELMEIHVKRKWHMTIFFLTAHADRPALVRSFQTDPSVRVALLSITACAEGITLTAAKMVRVRITFNFFARSFSQSFIGCLALLSKLKLELIVSDKLMILLTYTI